MFLWKSTNPVENLYLRTYFITSFAHIQFFIYKCFNLFFNICAVLTIITTVLYINIIRNKKTSKNS